MNAMFDFCVRLLLFLADQTGLTYKEINVWIFVILWPLFTLGLIAVVIMQHRKIRSHPPSPVPCSLPVSREGRRGERGEGIRAER
jgi:hypothetical protein